MKRWIAIVFLFAMWAIESDDAVQWRERAREAEARAAEAEAWAATVEEEAGQILAARCRR